MKELIIAFGLFLFIEGILYALFPSKMKSMLKKKGRAQYSMFFDHYSKVPQNVQDEVTKKIAG